MFLLTISKAWMNQFAFIKIINLLSKINKASVVTFLSIMLVSFSWHVNAKAESIEVGELIPIVNLVLQGNIQCPSVETSSLDNNNDIFNPVLVDENGVLSSFVNGSNQSGISAEELGISSDLTGTNQIQGAILISNQQGVDALSGVVRIDGSLIVSSQSATQVLDLSALDSLVEVTGDVFISTANTNLSAFNCLSTIGGELNIQNSSNLQSISGFQSLKSIGGSFIVIVNNVLTRLGGFPQLASIGIDFRVSFNEQLRTITGFQALESVGNDFALLSNPFFDNLANFNTLTSIGRDFRLSSNSRLASVNGFSNLESIGNDLNVLTNASLVSIGGFASLKQIIGDLLIFDNQNLQSIGSLASLERGEVVLKCVF